MSKKRDNTDWLLLGLGALLLLGGGGFAAYEMTRGLRNNNPGNIVFSNFNAWKGKVMPNTDGTFEQFDTMQNGVRALKHVLQNYSNEGFNTVDSIIRRFSATDQDAYVADVADALVADPLNTPINAFDPATLFALVRAIISQEQGAIPAATISDDVVREGLAA